VNLAIFVYFTYFAGHRGQLAAYSATQARDGQKCPGVVDSSVRSSAVIVWTKTRPDCTPYSAVTSTTGRQRRKAYVYFCAFLALPAQYAKQSLCNGTVSVCLSVPFARRCCECAVVGPANGRYRSIAARRSAANAGSATLSAGVGN